MGTFIPLEALEVASPCKADWNRMTGNEQARFCGTCTKHVYDLSGMSRAAAEELIRSKEGDICIRLTRRADGTVITNDCPVGSKTRQRATPWSFSAFTFLLGALLTVCGTAAASDTPQAEEPIAPTEPTATEVIPTIMGRIVCPQPEPKPEPEPAPDVAPEPAEPQE